jgi:hypothetical protein
MQLRLELSSPQKVASSKLHKARGGGNLGNAETVEIPKSRTNGWKGSWKKYFFELMYTKGTYMLYPNFLDQLSLSTNHLEKGEHIAMVENNVNFTKATSSHQKVDFTVPLLKDKMKLYSLKKVDLPNLPIFNLFGKPWNDAHSLEDHLSSLENSIKFSEQQDTNVIREYMGSHYKKGGDIMWYNEEMNSAKGTILQSKNYYYDTFSKKTKKRGKVITRYYCMLHTNGNLAIYKWNSLSPLTFNPVWDARGLNPHNDMKHNDEVDGNSYHRIRFVQYGSLVLESINLDDGKTKEIWRTPADMRMFKSGVPKNIGYSKQRYFLRLESTGNLVIYRHIESGSCKIMKDVIWQSYSNASTKSSSIVDVSEACSRIKARRLSFCKTFPIQINSFFKDPDSFTLMISTYSRFDTISKQLWYYSQSPIIKTIIVTWHNMAITPPIDAKINDTVIHFLVPNHDSLNNRFSPHLYITSECVMIIDDDMKIDLQDIHNIFHVWRYNQYNIVGFSPRWVKRKTGIQKYDIDSMVYLEGSEAPTINNYNNRRASNINRGYTFVLTKAMMLHRDYLRLYTCGGQLLNNKYPINRIYRKFRDLIHYIVDTSLNCEDIGINFIANLALHPYGRSAPLYINPVNFIGDFGKQSKNDSLHLRSSHMKLRSDCVNRMNMEYFLLTNRNVPNQWIEIRAVKNQSKSYLYKRAYSEGIRKGHIDCFGNTNEGACAWNHREKRNFTSQYHSVLKDKEETIRKESDTLPLTLEHGIFLNRVQIH